MPSVLQVIYYLKQNIFRSSIFRACMIRFVLYLSCITFGWLNKDFAFFSRRESNKYDGRHGKTIIFKKTSGLPQEDFWETNRAQMLDVAVFTLSLPYWDQYLSLSCISYQWLYKYFQIEHKYSHSQMHYLDSQLARKPNVSPQQQSPCGAVSKEYPSRPI